MTSMQGQALDRRLYAMRLVEATLNWLRFFGARILMLNTNDGKKAAELARKKGHLEVRIP
ncbi:MAG: hypothetical protein ACP5PL_05180 [Infirmifilum sp.]